jgi:exodeoxyribonuclease V alpha subunit
MTLMISYEFAFTKKRRFRCRGEHEPYGSEPAPPLATGHPSEYNSKRAHKIVLEIVLWLSFIPFGRDLPSPTWEPGSSDVTQSQMELQHLQGVVERLTYVTEDGYTVLRLKARGHADLVTVVGHLPDLSPGESLKLEGRWVRHAQYGRQFQAERCEQLLPATVEGLRRYLGSGLIKGVGPVTAAHIVKRFGLDTLRVLEKEPQRLREALGVGPKRAQLIARAWEDQKAIKEVMLFLQSHGVTTGLAVKIFKTYGDEALEIVQRDPYRLARDIWGVGFKTADKVASDLGLPRDAPGRVQAGVAYTLSQLADDGHVYAPEEQLLSEASQLLQIQPELVSQAVEALAAEEAVKRETLVYAPSADPPTGAGEGQAVREERAVYLTPFYYGEVGVSNRLRGLVETPSTRLHRFRQVRAWAPFLDQLTRRDGIQLIDQQREAVRTALTHKVAVLTGGPGTGKTTTMRTVIAALERMGCSYALASPTGRAAKRLSEATGRPAKTVHRLLGYKPAEGFGFNDENPLPVDMLVVDEASMLDLLLTNHLLKALDPAAHLLLVGDVDQLPSVGAGDVLRDVIASGEAEAGRSVAIVRLETIFRQAEGSYIIHNSHRINQGQFPIVNKGDDFFLFTQDDPEQAAALVVDVVGNRIPHKFGLDPLDDVQVLSPMHRGAVGVANLNHLLQNALNPPAPNKPERRLGGRTLRVGDKVMQIRNNYDKETYNGDIGRLVAIDLENQTLTVQMDDRPIPYDWTEADEIVHAYAISVHKSQGSEFPSVVVPVMTQHYLMLQRNLLYTAVTRAKRLVVLVGQRRAVSIAARNNRVAQRYSGLSVRLGAR